MQQVPELRKAPLMRFREKDSGGRVDAVRNTGAWPPIIEFLDSIGAGRVPFGSRPAITRNPDGTLHVCGPEGCSPAGCTLAEVGDWVTGAGGVFRVVKPDEFEATFEAV